MSTKKTKFKETEIGLIPEEWNVFCLTEIADVIGGGTPKTNESSYWDGEIPWLSVVDFNNGAKKVYKTEKTITDKGVKNSSVNILGKGSLVISARGTVGALTQLGVDMAFNQSCYGLVAKSVSSDFLYYLVKNSISDIKNQTHGSVFDTITRETLNNIKFLIPKNSNEQQKIAEILSSLDDKIELNRKINDNLEKITRSLFKRWFVDFEFPNKDGKPYKSSGGKMINSEIGEIPDEWKIGFFGDNELTGFIKSGIDNFDNEKIYLDTASVGNSLITDFSTKITINERPSRANMQPQISSVWFAKMKDSRKLLFFDDYLIEALDNYILSTGFAGFKVKPAALYYIWTFILSDEFNAEKNNLCQGTTMQAINNENISKIKYLISLEEILLSFNNLTKHFYQEVEVLKSQNIRLSEIRDCLLSKLMSGKIRV